MDWLAKGDICPHIDRILPLGGARQAMQLIVDRAVQGRVVLKI
jgi:NADPH2:quinone reductase